MCDKQRLVGHGRLADHILHISQQEVGSISFNSLQYAIFLPAVVLVYFVLPQRLRWPVLLVASYYFYMSWNPQLVVLILFTTCTSYFAALCIQRWRNRPRRSRLVLALGISSSLLCLFFFKYFNFFSQSVTAVLRNFSLPVGEFTLQVMLPVGISFYTFQTLSYIIDVYRGKLPAERHFGIYALYVSFFPQLVAGPIERAVNLLPQFYEKHSFSTGRTSEGLRLILLGLFKKVVVADYVARFVNTVYGDLTQYAGLSLVAATLLFGLQLYCDFSGYSDIALGSARILGFRLCENFRSPFFSRSIREHWRRWHISLSTWFSDYVYIPLGGSRVPRWRHLCNLMITFLLSGLWHGAAWTYVVWGAYHGVLLCADVFVLPWRERRLAALRSRPVRWLANGGCWLITFGLTMVGYIFFRAQSFADCAYVFSHLRYGLNPLRLMEYLQPMGITPGVLCYLLFLVLVIALWDWLNYKGDGMERFQAFRPFLRYAIYFVLALLLLLRVLPAPGNVAVDFIYFQF